MPRQTRASFRAGGPTASPLMALDMDQTNNRRTVAVETAPVPIPLLVAHPPAPAAPAAPITPGPILGTPAPGSSGPRPIPTLPATKSVIPYPGPLPSPGSESGDSSAGSVSGSYVSELSELSSDNDSYDDSQ
ncbi:hypothetical protein QBC38DRAFT_455566 [Podospora fimiseda]|uniref:Uncharacterized protein n=1 Tax=Podospora fimiseda TaxID=252190 RepID=A0AAN7H4B2_9PEZI|nr:hypothetical protein QBC38DRAFT_455566 [Podospora fimiseda]